jgi:uncharacterized membrane protein (DUF485 family)
VDPILQNKKYQYQEDEKFYQEVRSQKKKSWYKFKLYTWAIFLLYLIPILGAIVVISLIDHFLSYPATGIAFGIFLTGYIIHGVSSVLVNVPFMARIIYPLGYRLEDGCNDWLTVN